jgi:hypothetical protein
LYGIEVVVQIEVLIALWVSVLFVEREEGQEEGKMGGLNIFWFWSGIFRRF